MLWDISLQENGLYTIQNVGTGQFASCAFRSGEDAPVFASDSVSYWFIKEGQTKKHFMYILQRKYWLLVTNMWGVVEFTQVMVLQITGHWNTTSKELRYVTKCFYFLMVLTCCAGDFIATCTRQPPSPLGVWTASRYWHIFHASSSLCKAIWRCVQHLSVEVYF